MDIEFSERQRTTIAAAITILSAVVILLAIGALFWIVGAFFVKFSAVFLPLAVAMVAALVVNPYYEAIATRLKLGRVPALIVVFLSFIVPVVGLGWFFGDLIVDQAKGLIEAFPTWWAATVEWVRARAPQLVHFLNETAFGQAVGDAVEGQSGAVVDVAQYVGRRMVSAGAGVLSGVATLLGWVVAPIYFAFFLMAEIPQHHRRLFPRPAHHRLSAGSFVRDRLYHRRPQVRLRHRAHPRFPQHRPLSR
jgi:predicted PurR-regulated permease PerM